MHSSSSIPNITGSGNLDISSEESAARGVPPLLPPERDSSPALIAAEVGARTLAQQDSTGLAEPKDTRRYSNPVFGKQLEISRRTSLSAASSSVMMSSELLASSAAESQTIKHNPLYGSLKFKEFRDEGAGLLKFPAVLSESDYNKIAEKWVYNKVAGSLVPSRSFLHYSVFRTLSSLLERKPRPKSIKCSDLRTQLFLSGAVTNCLLEPARLAFSRLAAFVELNKRSTPCLAEALELLKSLERWNLIEDFAEKSPSVDKLIDLYRFCLRGEPRERGGRELLINILFESLQNYAEVLEWLSAFFSQPKNLKSLIGFLRAKETDIDEGALDLGRSYNVESLSAVIPKITSSSVQRAFFLGDAPNIEKVSVNGAPFFFHDPKTALAERKKSYFSQLLERCFSDIEQETPLDHFIFQESQSILEGGEAGGVGLQLLSCGTVETWSVADRMIRFLFPGLNQAPFIFKMPQSTEVDIRVQGIGNFTVAQRKTYEICLRKRPGDPSCPHKLEGPLCSAVFEWRVHSNREGEGWQARGELAIRELHFSPKITPYEKREILFSLLKPCPVPAEWRSLPYPSVEREMPVPQ